MSRCRCTGKLRFPASFGRQSIDVFSSSPNNLLTHPLISLVNQGSLGGLCPLFIVGGGGELLRDEVDYLRKRVVLCANRSSDNIPRPQSSSAGNLPAIEKYALSVPRAGGDGA
jgi:hypothetical protein